MLINAHIMIARNVHLSDDVSFANAFPVSAIVHGSSLVIFMMMVDIKLSKYYLVQLIRYKLYVYFVQC